MTIYLFFFTQYKYFTYLKWLLTCTILLVSGRWPFFLRVGWLTGHPVLLQALERFTLRPTAGGSIHISYFKMGQISCISKSQSVLSRTWSWAFYGFTPSIAWWIPLVIPFYLPINLVKMIEMMKHLMPLCPGKFSPRCQEMTVFALILTVACESHLPLVGADGRESVAFT